jgi:hypothetical protein
MRTSLSILLFLVFMPSLLFSQFKIELGEGKELTITQAVQVWDVVSFQMNTPDAIDKRNDLYFRRGRLGLEGKLRADMSFNLSIAYDGIGKDPYTPTAGTPNAGDNRDLFIWDASWIWSFSPEFNLVFGYFRPQVGKEQISSEFYMLSLDKSLADIQPRQHLLARSAGRETGANIGGLCLHDGWSLNYNVGMFDPSSKSIVGNGTKWSPLLTGRIAFTVGDPEMKQYKISYVQSYYGKRNGTTLGINGARQGATEIFSYNTLYGVDMLSNYGPFDFNAEYDWLDRSTILPSGNVNPTTDKVYSIKAGYIFECAEHGAFEPSIMYTGERAVENGAVHATNGLTGSVSRDLYDVGLNWLINNDKFKINLHYIWGKRYDKAPDDNFSYLGLGMQLLY